MTQEHPPCGTVPPPVLLTPVVSAQQQKRRARVRAAELVGRQWLNTGGKELRLEDFRGKVVILDFWTFCCINCLHVIDELRPLEAEFADEVVTVGVHSPKFEHEADADALAAAVERYDVRHPVLDDPELMTWQAYTARAWPTLVLIDPEGYVVAQYAGEGHAHAVDALLSELREEHAAKGTLQPGDSPYVAPPVPEGDLRFPAKALRLADRHLLVADAGHRAIVEVDRHGALVRRLVEDLEEPNGLCLLPPEVATEVGYDVVVAETVGHRLVGLTLASGEARVLAGDGQQWMQGDGTDRLSSPWDVVWHDGLVWVAMAGIHQLWTFDPRSGDVRVAAGTTNEGLLDGPLAEAWLAQTSGLVSDGDRLWVVDSETSSLRYVEDGTLHTAVGRGLFDFGFTDGPAADALFQHPLGAAVLPDGSVAVADTYNGAVRRYDRVAGTVSTVATGLAEPSGLVVDGDQLVVVESAAHRLTRVPLGASAQASGSAHTTQRPVTEVAPGALEIVVSFEPPPGQKVDDRFGPPSQLLVEATPPALVKDGDGRGTDLVRTVVLDASVGDGVLHVAARAASCDEGDGEGAACHMHQQDWGVPVRVVEGGATRLVLPLSGRS